MEADDDPLGIRIQELMKAIESKGPKRRGHRRLRDARQHGPLPPGTGTASSAETTRTASRSASRDWSVGKSPGHSGEFTPQLASSSNSVQRGRELVSGGGQTGQDAASSSSPGEGGRSVLWTWQPRRSRSGTPTFRNEGDSSVVNELEAEVQRLHAMLQNRNDRIFALESEALQTAEVRRSNTELSRKVVELEEQVATIDTERKAALEALQAARAKSTRLEGEVCAYQAAHAAGPGGTADVPHFEAQRARLLEEELRSLRDRENKRGARNRATRGELQRWRSELQDVGGGAASSSGASTGAIGAAGGTEAEQEFSPVPPLGTASPQPEEEDGLAGKQTEELSSTAASPDGGGTRLFTWKPDSVFQEPRSPSGTKMTSSGGVREGSPGHPSLPGGDDSLKPSELLSSLSQRDFRIECLESELQAARLQAERAESQSRDFRAEMHAEAGSRASHLELVEMDAKAALTQAMEADAMAQQLSEELRHREEGAQFLERAARTAWAEAAQSSARVAELEADSRLQTEELNRLRSDATRAADNVLELRASLELNHETLKGLEAHVDEASECLDRLRRENAERDVAERRHLAEQREAASVSNVFEFRVPSSSPTTTRSLLGATVAVPTPSTCRRAGTRSPSPRLQPLPMMPLAVATRSPTVEAIAGVYRTASAPSVCCDAAMQATQAHGSGIGRASTPSHSAQLALPQPQLMPTPVRCLVCGAGFSSPDDSFVPELAGVPHAVSSSPSRTCFRVNAPLHQPVTVPPPTASPAVAAQMQPHSSALSSQRGPSTPPQPPHRTGIEPAVALTPPAPTPVAAHGQMPATIAAALSRGGSMQLHVASPPSTGTAATSSVQLRSAGGVIHAPAMGNGGTVSFPSSTVHMLPAQPCAAQALRPPGHVLLTRVAASAPPTSYEFGSTSEQHEKPSHGAC